MPTIEYKRVWCLKCQDWKLHKQYYPNWDDWFCEDCETKHESTFLKDIPEEKILEQRERYKESERESMDKILGEFMNPNLHFLREMFSEPGSDVRIIEADAGQVAIDKKIKEKEAKKRMERHEKRIQDEAEIKKYKDLRRNDKCICGSSLKYKKCCLTRINELWAKL